MNEVPENSVPSCRWGRGLRIGIENVAKAIHSQPVCGVLPPRRLTTAVDGPVHIYNQLIKSE